MIIYFTGTGNTRLLARRLAELLDDECVDLRTLQAEGRTNLTSERPWLFCLPTYAWRIPLVAEAWLQQLQFAGSNDAYYLMTCGDSAGNADAYLREFSASVGLNYRGLSIVLMPENYTAMFPVPDAAESERIVQAGLERMSGLAKLVQDGQDFPQGKITARDKILSRVANPLFYKIFVHDKRFKLKGKCIKCKKCVVVCPLGNVSLGEDGPQWGGNCTHCMACINVCPETAIEYGRTSQGRRRHYIP